jgi:P27 family predicted phage terminase small subunit
MPADRLTEIGQLAWIHLRVELEPLGLLTGADAFTLEALCYHVSMMAECAREVRTEGVTLVDHNMRVYRNPADAAYVQHSTSYNRLAGEFGLSPSSRTRLSTLAADPEEQSLADLLFEGTDAAKKGANRQTPLRKLVGKKAADILADHGLGSLELAATAAREGFDLAAIPGIGNKTLQKLEEIEW